MTLAPTPADDHSLLTRYAQNRDPEAFAELARRYAGLVLAIAQRITGSTQDAEDIAQTCFLDLAKNIHKTLALRSLPAYLHRAATTRALNRRRDNLTRRSHESQSPPASSPDITWQQLLPLVDAAINQLPDHLRLPLLLHYQQNQSQSQIATTLHISQPTASRRLENAVAQLRTLLHSATPSFVATTLSQTTAPVPPLPLLASFNKIGLATLPKSAAPLLSFALAAKLATAAAVLLLTAAGIHYLLAPIAALPPIPLPVATLAATAPSTSPAPADAFVGTILNEQNQPAPNIQVTFLYATPPISTQTTADGHFSLPIPENSTYTRIVAATTDRLHQIYFDRSSNGTLLQNVRLTLQPARQFPITTLDSQRNPVPGAKILTDAPSLDGPLTDSSGHVTLLLPANAPFDFILALKPNVGSDYQLFREPNSLRSDPYHLEPNFTGPLTFTLNGARSVSIRAIDEQSHPLPSATVYPWYIEKPKKGGMANLSMLGPVIYQTTNADGIAAFPFIPADNLQGVEFWITSPGYTPSDQPIWKTTSPDTLTVTMQKLIPVTGIVKDNQGHPVPNAVIRVGADSYAFNHFRAEPLQSLADGTFTIDVNPDEYYIFMAQYNHDVSPPVYRSIFHNAPEPVELKLQPGIHVYGQVSAAEDHHSVSPIIYLQRRDNSYGTQPHNPDFPIGSHGKHILCPFTSQSVKPDSHGNFEFYTNPGDYYLDTFIGSSRVSQDFLLTADDTDKEVDLHGDSDSPLPTALHGKVVLADKPDQGVPEISLTGHPTDQLNGGMVDPEGTTDRNGNFEIRTAKSPMLLIASTSNGNLAASLLVKPTDDNITLSLAPTATLRGRLLDADGKPWPAQILVVLNDFKYRRTSTLITGPQITTRSDGSFSYPGLIPDQTYTLYLNQKNSRGNIDIFKLTEPITPESAGAIEVGDLSRTGATTAP